MLKAYYVSVIDINLFNILIFWLEVVVHSHIIAENKSYC